jgi:hypothetical protein
MADGTALPQIILLRKYILEKYIVAKLYAEV